MAKPYLAVCGHTNLDVLLHVDVLPAPGESRPVKSRRRMYGGTACNIARHAAGLGVPVRLWSRVGRDFPPDWRVELEDAGVDLSFLDIDPERDTPTCFVLTDAHGQQSYCMDQAAMSAMVEHPPPADLVEGVSWLHIGTGSPEAWRHVVPAARSAGVSVAFDPGQEIHFSYDAASLEEMLEACDLLWVNTPEAQRACRLLEVDREEDLLRWAPMVVVTRQEKGLSLLRRGKARLDLAAEEVRVVDPTGAGDALRAGFYAGLFEGRDLEAALQLGQQAAAVCVGMNGPQERTITRSLLPQAAAT